MFTGIVAALGKIVGADATDGGLSLRIETAGEFLADVATGDSIAVNGVCLTATRLDANAFEADVSRETLNCTAGFARGKSVNLEKSLRLSDRLGGHLVSGHVDGVATVASCETVGDNRVVTFAAPADLAQYLARKGSVALDGVSLTVNAVSSAQFSVNLIPHTLQVTSLRDLQVGDKVNLEVDLLARYAERLLKVEPRSPGTN
jgi:riboflavin synthase